MSVLNIQSSSSISRTSRHICRSHQLGELQPSLQVHLRASSPKAVTDAQILQNHHVFDHSSISRPLHSSLYSHSSLLEDETIWTNASCHIQMRFKHMLHIIKWFDFAHISEVIDTSMVGSPPTSSSSISSQMITTITHHKNTLINTKYYDPMDID